MENAALVRQLEEDPDSALSLNPDAAFKPEVFHAWIRRVVELISANPRVGLAHVETAKEIATCRCHTVQCLGMESSAHLALGQFDEALALLEKAFKRAKGCPACIADLYRRRGLVLGAAGRQAEALADEEAAIRAYQDMAGQPDHDLRGNGLARSYMARGDIRQHFGVLVDDTISGARDDFYHVLSLTNSRHHQTIRGHAHQALSYVLRVMGGLDNLLEAEEHIREAQKYFKGRKRKRASREKAYMDWQTAMLRLRLLDFPEGREVVKEYPSSLRKTMRDALEDFVEVNMPIEASGVASDLLRLTWPKRGAVCEMVEEFLPVIGHVWDRVTGEVLAAREPIEEALRAVSNAADQDFDWTSDADVLRTDGELRGSIDFLRRVCEKEGRLQASLLVWPEKSVRSLRYLNGVRR